FAPPAQSAPIKPPERDTLDLSEVRRKREAALNNGYQVIRIRSRAKTPISRNWQEGEQLTALLRVTADAANTGLLCRGLRVIDIDVDDAVVVVEILNVVGRFL